MPPADLGPDVGQGAQVIMLCGICDGMGTLAVGEPSPGPEDGADEVALVKWLGCSGRLPQDEVLEQRQAFIAARWEQLRQARYMACDPAVGLVHA